MMYIKFTRLWLYWLFDGGTSCMVASRGRRTKEFDWFGLEGEMRCPAAAEMNDAFPSFIDIDTPTDSCRHIENEAFDFWAKIVLSVSKDTENKRWWILRIENFSWPNYSVWEFDFDWEEKEKDCLVNRCKFWYHQIIGKHHGELGLGYNLLE